MVAGKCAYAAVLAAAITVYGPVPTPAVLQQHGLELAWFSSDPDYEALRVALWFFIHVTHEGMFDMFSEEMLSSQDLIDGIEYLTHVEVSVLAFMFGLDAALLLVCAPRQAPARHQLGPAARQLTGNGRRRRGNSLATGGNTSHPTGAGRRAGEGPCDFFAWHPPP
jgi:hypothetical protein